MVKKVFAFLVVATALAACAQIIGIEDLPTFCGDGLASPGEACDDGDGNNNDDCPDGPDGTCQVAQCGDGFVDRQAPQTESCDDGNDDDTDGCTSQCEAGPYD